MKLKEKFLKNIDRWILLGVLLSWISLGWYLLTWPPPVSQGKDSGVRLPFETQKTK